MRSIRIAVVAILAIGFVAASPPPAKMTAAQIDAQCRQFHHDACSEALGEWLPTFGDSSDWSSKATRIHTQDDFVYVSRGSAVPRRFGLHGPEDGTSFFYGLTEVGGGVVYDSSRRVAFFEQGSCAWNDVVLAGDAPSPPKAVVGRDLAGVATIRGIRLGQTPVEVAKIYGPSKLLPVTGHPGVGVLAYTTWPPRDEVLASKHDPCGQVENFFFRNDRLVLIQLGNSC